MTRASTYSQRPAIQTTMALRYLLELQAITLRKAGTALTQLMYATPL